MDTLQSWSVGILSISCITTLMRMTLPKSIIEGGIGFALNLVVLLVVLSPIPGFTNRLKGYDYEEIPPLSFGVEEYALGAVEENLSANLLSFLWEYGINPSDPRIDITITTVEEEGLRLFLSLPQEYDCSLTELTTALEGYLEIPVTVTKGNKEEIGGEDEGTATSTG